MACATRARADASETLFDASDILQTSEINEADSSEEKIEALSEIICRAGEEPSAALLVLMATLANSTHPEALANTVRPA